MIGNRLLQCLLARQTEEAARKGLDQQDILLPMLPSKVRLYVEDMADMALEDKKTFKQINIKRTVKSELLVNLSSREPSWPKSDTSSRTFKPGAQKLKLSTRDCGQSHFETATVTTSLNTNRSQAVAFLSQVDGRSILRSPAGNFSSEAASDLMSDKVIAFWRYYRRLEIRRRGWGRDITKK